MERTTLTERLRRAETEIAAGRPEQALAYCQELQTAYPRALRVQRVLGEIYLALRRPREALAALDRALAGDPEDARVCCARALVHQMHGDDVSALAWYRRACDLRPDDQALRATYRGLARRLGEPPYSPSRAGLARLYLRGDLFAHAIREWEQLVVESPDMLDAQVGLAETLWIAGHTRAADERCRRILANAPSCVKAMLIQMALALTEGDMDTARMHLDRTIQLDPDMTIAQVFFADALASGDPVLTALLRGDDAAADGENAQETMKIGRVTAGFAQSAPLAGQRNLSRPLVTSAPVVDPAFGASQPISQPLPPPRPDVPVPSQPTEVTRAFKETAFMIWGKDDDSQPRVPAQQPGDGDVRDAEPVAPPVLRELGGVMDDDETRRALNWYNWLQSQGAVALGATAISPAPTSPAPERPHGTTVPIQGVNDLVDASTAPPNTMNGNAAPPLPPAPQPRLTMPIPPSMPMMPPVAPAMPAEPQGMSLRDEEPETAPLPLPTPESLRTMFAELGGNTDAGPAIGPVVEAGGAPPASTVPLVPLATPEPDVEVNAHGADGADDLSGALWPAAANTSGGAHDVAYDEPYDESDDDSPAIDGDGQPPTQTIEELERHFAASGFTPIEPRPGLLAEIDREQQAGGAATTSREQSTDDEPAFVVAPMDPAKASEPAPSGPDARDYPARLAHARQRRDDGQFDEALNEYRVIIKNAPDLLPEVLSDLRASLDELPDHPTLHSVLGDALVSQGEYEKALESYNKATELAQARSGRA
jgi:tetratricopeptide (TPR) repeat protein